MHVPFCCFPGLGLMGKSCGKARRSGLGATPPQVLGALPTIPRTPAPTLPLSPTTRTPPQNPPSQTKQPEGHAGTAATTAHKDDQRPGGASGQTAAANGQEAKRRQGRAPEDQPRQHTARQNAAREQGHTGHCHNPGTRPGPGERKTARTPQMGGQTGSRPATRAEAAGPHRE